MLRKLKWQIPGERLAARYNWCQGPVPGRGPAVEKHCQRRQYNTAHALCTATMVARTRSNVTLYVHCLSCSYLLCLVISLL